jgi:SAM-dependent methyltransferase
VTSDAPAERSALFSQQSRDYCLYRPRYPEGLFDFLAGLTRSRRLAWDCGTGSGQSAAALAAKFESVVASDASAAQLAHAARAPNLAYVVAASEQAPLLPDVADLVTAAQSLHWFDLPAFYAEVRRVMRRGGVLAAWCYHRSEICRAIDDVLERLYDETLARDWSSRVRLANEHYETVPFPFPRVPPPAFSAEADWVLDDLVGYVRSWSAVASHRRRTGRDPLDRLVAELRPLWGDPSTRRRVRWPLHFLVGRVE